MKRTFSLFTYPMMDIKAAEGALNRKAAAGWRLEKLWLGLLASFVPAEGPVRYCIDWIDPALRPDRPSYAALLAEAGWRRRALLGSWAIYEGPADALPIQTDSALEYQRFRRKVLRRMAIGGAVAAVILLLLLGLLLAGSGGRFAWRACQHAARDGFPCERGDRQASQRDGGPTPRGAGTAANLTDVFGKRFYP